LLILLIVLLEEIFSFILFVESVDSVKIEHFTFIWTIFSSSSTVNVINASRNEHTNQNIMIILKAFLRSSLQRVINQTTNTGPTPFPNDNDNIIC